MSKLLRPQGYITSGFSNEEAYRENPHTGIDWKYGFKKPCYALHDGITYKVVGKNDPNLQTYRNIYQLCDTDFGTVEIAYVHCWDMWIAEEDFVMAGTPIYTEGNTGVYVYQNGVQVKPEDKPSGKGSHSHISVRHVDKVKTLTAGHYLNDSKGNRYKDKDGNYYKIRNEGAMKGWVDYKHMLYTPTKDQLLIQFKKVLGFIRHF